MVFCPPLFLRRVTSVLALIHNILCLANQLTTNSSYKVDKTQPVFTFARSPPLLPEVVKHAFVA
jgi:hypothetical protein